MLEVGAGVGAEYCGAKLVVELPVVGAKFVVVEEPAAGVGLKLPAGKPGTWLAKPPSVPQVLQGPQVPVAQSLVIVVTGTLYVSCRYTGR